MYEDLITKVKKKYYVETPFLHIWYADKSINILKCLK